MLSFILFSLYCMILFGLTICLVERICYFLNIGDTIAKWTKRWWL